MTKTELTAKIISIVGIIVLVLNIILAALNKISLTAFWIIIGSWALLAYFGLPRLRKK